MDLFEPNLITKKEVRFAEGLVPAASSSEENFGDIFGGIIKSGQWGWLTKGSRLCITSLRSGQSISKYDFDATNGFGVCIITCVSEIQMPYLKDTLIAIGIQYADSPGGLAVLYSVEESTIICCIDLKHKITCCRFISHEVSQHTILQNMNGCLAVGTDGGSVLLVDLNLRNVEVSIPKEDSGISVVPCHIVDYSMSLLHLHRHFQHCQQEGVHFGIQLEVLENAEFIQSLLPIDRVLGLAAGLADGRLVLYDLTDMQVFYVTPPQERSSPLVKMSSMEPPDDPRPCVYIWAFHENYQNSMAVMHSLMYEKRVVTDDGFCYFENFQVSSVRLKLPLNCPRSVPTACQAITKAPSHGNEETISLCALVWKQEQELRTEVLLFDINQWYKEEMPYVGDWRDDPSYLASFVLPGFSCLDMYFNPNTISLFNSIQRPEEHFYPISLSFDSIGLEEKSCFHLNWPGVQNRVIDVLRSQGSLALLDPNPIFLEVLNARLLPQFSGLNYKATFSLKAKRETLLSVAIENNCNGLLKECAKNWSDGSHQGTSLSEGLSLSTLTDWLWARASSIKERCNKLCKVLFDHSGYTLDQRERQELSYISKQLRTLADLSSDIISKYGENIPTDVLNTLESQKSSIRMASDYQEILMWLLNIGLLPEASRLTRHRGMELNLVPYPYESLRGFYEKRRIECLRYSSARKDRSWYLLFIDSFLEHSFKGNTLRDSWQESGGDGLYPPSSVQAMLRIMLIPDVSFENKCALFLYFFLDLNMAIEDKRYEPIVQNFIKFPSVFKLSASLIKQIQAFWNLDHCHFQAAVDEFISPFNKDHVCPQWQIELFIASLLNQIESNLALRVLEAKSLPISPLLQLNTYLANDLISEAFHFARSEKDEELLKLFFSRCLLVKKFGVIRDLALTESEEKLMQSLLKSTKNRSSEDLSFVYLLQKCKYIEAVAYQDELLKGRDIQRSVDELSKGRNNQDAMDIDNPTLVLSAYHATMTPVTKNISDVYLKIKNRIKNKETEQNSPYPLSCQLIKQNASDLLGGIYHSSALGTHFASHYWDQQKTEGNALQQSTNAPFLRSPQISLSYCEYNPRETISYPEQFKPAQKRRLDNSPLDSDKIGKIRENPKKRRKIYDRYDFELSTSDNLLTHFKNSTTYNQEVSNLTKISQKTPSRENSLFLDTPYVKNTFADNSISQMPQKLVTSLPGILKVSQPKTSIDETDRTRAPSEEPEKRKDLEEEKSIRFILPVDESLEQINEQDVSMEFKDDLKQCVDDSPQQLRSYTGPASRKSLRSTTMNYSSLIPISKNELQGILDKVKNEQYKQEPLLKATSIYDSNSSISKSPPKEVGRESSHILQVIEPEQNEDSAINLNSNPIEERRPGPFARKSLKSAIAFSSISKNELQDILDKVKDGQSKHVSVSKTTSIFESSSSIIKSTLSFGSLNSSDIFRGTESKKNFVFGEKMNVEQQQSMSLSSGNETKTTSFGFPKGPASKAESNLFSIDYTADKSEEQVQNPNISQFECFSKVDSYSGPNLIPPKRAFSESSDSHSNDPMQRNRKQLKGRASIHGSLLDVSKSKTPTAASEIEKFTNTLVQESKTVFSADTMINFKPHVSSSKVCTTESKFNKERTEPEKVIETMSKLQKSPKVTFSEQTTVVGELTSLPTMEVQQNLTEVSNITFQPIEKQKMLDTTVGMTLYDTILEQYSSSTDTFDNTEDHEEDEESVNSELNEFDLIDEKASENEEIADENSGSSIILLSSRSSSRTVSRNQRSKSPEFKSNEVAQRHISIDDDDDDDVKDLYFEESDEVDDNDSNDEEEVEEDEEEGSVEIIESDGSEDLSNSFSNKIRNVTSTSTSSSLASVVISENSIHSGVLMQDTTSFQNYAESSNSASLTATEKCKTTVQKESIEEQTSNYTTNTSEPELKLSVISEISQEKAIDVTIEKKNGANKNSCHAYHQHRLEESIIIQANDQSEETMVEDQRNKQIAVDKENKVQTEKETTKIESADSTKVQKVQFTVQHDEESMEIEDIAVATEKKQIEPLDENQLVPKNSATEQIQTEKLSEVQSFSKISEIEAIGNTKLDHEVYKVPIIDQEADQSMEICDQHLQNKESEVDKMDSIEENETKDEEAKNIQSNVVETAMPSKVIEEIQKVEAESTVAADVELTNIDFVNEENKQNITDEEPMSKLRSTSFSKKLTSKKIVAAESTVSSDITNKDSANEEKKHDAEEPTMKRRSKSFPKKLISEKVDEPESTVNEEKEQNVTVETEEAEEPKPELRSKSFTSEKVVEPELTVNTGASTKEAEEPALKLRSNSFSKKLLSEKFVEASPRSRRLSRSGSMPPVKTEVEPEINIDSEISNVGALDEEKQKHSSVDVELTPKIRNRRSSSFSKNLTSETEITGSPSTRRLSRGGSMPPSTTGNQIITRRKSLLLETLDELSTPDSPSSRTRSKVRSDSIDGVDVDSSSFSNVKRSRLSSISSITSIEQPQTPKTRRRNSMSVDKELVSTPKAVRTPRAVKTLSTEITNTPIKTPRRLSVSKKESPSDDTSPTANKPKVQKRQEKSVSKSPPEPEPETSQGEDYTLSRRLTRTQLAAMERNQALSKQPVMSPIIKKRRGSQNKDTESPPDVKGSDNESNSSRLSHISTASRRVTRSLALRENMSDDIASIASSTESGKRKRKRVKDQISPIATLKVIPEEVPSGSEGSETGKRPTRHKK